MQFHLNGFRPGDPEISEPLTPPDASNDLQSLPAEVDVLIVGCGPAGLALAAQLSAFPSINTRIIEQKSGRLLLGQADGVACRTMEMFNAFGFAERVMKEAYWVTETTFWRPDERSPERIVRSSRVQDTEDGLSEFPHVILNQARVHDFFLDTMSNSPTADAAGLLPPPHRISRIDPSVSPGELDPSSRSRRRSNGSIPLTKGQVETVAGAVRGRVRRRPQRGSNRHRADGSTRRFSQSALGCHGRAGRNRFSRHSPENGDSIYQRR